MVVGGILEEVRVGPPRFNVSLGSRTDGNGVETLARRLTKLHGSAAWSLAIGGNGDGEYKEPGDSGGVEEYLEYSALPQDWRCQAVVNCMESSYILQNMGRGRGTG